MAASLIELIGVISYISIFIIVVGVVFIRLNSEDRKLFSSLVLLLTLLLFLMVFYIPVIQFILFVLIILDLIYITYVYILPYFFTDTDRLLFVEVAKEVWDDLKVNETIIQEKKK